MQGKARSGEARSRRAWLGGARLGKARHGYLVTARSGLAWHGLVWLGGSRRGMARLGKVRMAMVGTKGGILMSKDRESYHNAAQAYRDALTAAYDGKTQKIMGKEAQAKVDKAREDWLRECEKMGWNVK